MKTLHGLKVRFCSSQVTAERKRGNADGGSELRAGVEPRLTRAQERVWTRGAEEGRGCVMHPVLMGRGKVPHSPAGCMSTGTVGLRSAGKASTSNLPLGPGYGGGRTLTGNQPPPLPGTTQISLL